MIIPRSEHPRPQMQRKDWKSLNGPWAFEIDKSLSGEARGLSREGAVFSREIQVPFCPESQLSGIHETDFMPGVWYQKKLDLTSDQLKKTIRLHFGAVDHEATVFINGRKAAHHVGGYTPFHVDLDPFIREGENTLTLFAQDDIRSPLVPRGKQSEEYFSHDCDYTRTTGIWQSVWLEFLPKTHIESFKLYPHTGENPSVTLLIKTSDAGTIYAEAYWDGFPCGKASARTEGSDLSLTLPLSESHLWEVGKGGLYDLLLTFTASETSEKDEVMSYFGLRSVSLTDKAFLLNDRPVFQRLILDQGFYPDGIYTAPTDEALVKDIELSMSMGFNGARLHEKVFEERFLYHADRLGYLVWGEYPSWGLDHTRPDAVYAMLPVWMEVLERDFNHPSLIGWCPFNETWDQHHNCPVPALFDIIYELTKGFDRTRPCIDTSGGYHVKTDLFDVHDYTQDPQEFQKHFPGDGTFFDRLWDRHRESYKGQPLFVSEYGGIGLKKSETEVWRKGQQDGKLSPSDAWSYGNAASGLSEYLERFRLLTETLLFNPDVAGLCYTQLTDIEQEQNGLLTYDRVPKAPPETFCSILSQTAAIERQEGRKKGA